MATIQCKCGSVRLEFAARSELFRHECCCHDCISALWYATQRGGPDYPRDLCADCCWLPNDFRIAAGEDSLSAFVNFPEADSTRFYCTACWTVLFADHDFYERRIVVSQIAAYEEFQGLSGIERMAPQARHFVKDRSEEERDAIRPWRGDPAHVYEGVADNLLEAFPRMQAEGSEGAGMNAQILLGRIGGALVPTDEPRLSTGPPSLMRQMADQADETP